MRWLKFCAAVGLIAVLVQSACQTSPGPQVYTPVVGPTEFVQTRVASLLTEGAPPPGTVAPADTPAAAATLTAPRPATPTATASPPPSQTATATEPPIPTLDLSRFPAPPPAVVDAVPHFFFGPPLGQGGNNFPASTYRYGSTSQGRFSTHHGLDYGNPAGVAVIAVAPGRVYYAGSDEAELFGPSNDFYGNVVVIQLAQTWQGRAVFALYGHLSEVVVVTGQAVGQGEAIGRVGAAGVALGPHLHLEVRLDDPRSYWTTRNPELWLAPAAGTGTLAVRVTNASGQYLPGMRVEAFCADGARRVLDTYWSPQVNPDDVLGENAAITNVPAGFCRLETRFAGRTLEAAGTVAAGAVTFVWLRP